MNTTPSSSSPGNQDKIHIDQFRDHLRSRSSSPGHPDATGVYNSVLTILREVPIISIPHLQKYLIKQAGSNFALAEASEAFSALCEASSEQNADIAWKVNEFSDYAFHYRVFAKTYKELSDFLSIEKQGDSNEPKVP